MAIGNWQLGNLALRHSLWQLGNAAWRHAAHASGNLLCGWYRRSCGKWQGSEDWHSSMQHLSICEWQLAMWLAPAQLWDCLLYTSDAADDM
eukprot:15366772-Alexandrium_andersonii.AAC.1